MRYLRGMLGGIVLSALLGWGGPGPGGAQPLPPAKKLIEYGWDVPTPDYVRQNIRAMEELPFDGLIFRLPHDAGVIFTPEKRDEALFAQAFEDCRNIEWRKFTDNFLCLYAASTMDWFSDPDWEAVRHNLGIVAKAAALARCKGLCFDPEPYGNNPWDYPNQAHAREKSFAEYQAKVRQRGAEFMQTILAYLPRPVIHTFFQLSLFGEVMEEPDPVRREQLLSQHGYALLPAFLNGMLDAAGPDVIITDGNEPAYYYTDPLQYYRVYHLIRQRALALVAPENVRKYQAQVQVSQALYVDYVFGLGVWGERSVPARALTAEEKARWFEHNTYYALQTSDEYVWLYSEQMDWWKNDRLPPGLREAVESARRKLANREPLGFEMADLLKAAREKQEAELRAKLIRRTATIPRLKANLKPPVIDGQLDDPVWQETPPLEEFVRYVTVPNPQPEAPTRAWVTYDDQHLYLAFRCAEPRKEAMKVVGLRRDDSIWMGDSVDIFLTQGESPTPYVHLILNPQNVQWDALHTTQDDLGFNPRWQSATALGDAEWTAEVAIPWAEVHIPPPSPGTKLGANLCRQRIPGEEQSCWSQTISGFVEEKSFGTWVF
jgi:hypothetical protein